MILYFILFYVAQTCGAVIHSLNDSEYDQMPPLFRLDDYHSCLNKFKSPYCVARWDLFAEPSNKLITLIQEYSEYAPKHYNHTYIQWGVCVGTTCKNFINKNDFKEPDEFHDVLQECINDTIWRNYELQAQLTDVYYCDNSDEVRDYDWSDWAFGALILIVIIINVIGTVYDVIRNYNHQKFNKNAIEEKDGGSYIICFSIFSNWKYLTATESKDVRFYRLRGLHGIRALVSFLMPIAHVIWLMSFGFTDNPGEFEKSFEKLPYQLIFNGMMIVQIFFTMSGFLMVYCLQVYLENKQVTWSLLPKAFAYRWLRLTPMNALMIAYSSTWLRHASDGPLWKLNVVGVASDCRKYWWSHLFYFNNYLEDNKVCAIQTWHLAADGQLFLLGLIVYIATGRSGNIFALASLLIFSMMAPAMNVWCHKFDPLVLLKPEFYRTFHNETYHLMHVRGHNNLTAFLIGMIAGYLAYYMLKNGIDVFTSKIWKYLAWLIVPAYMGVFLSGNVFYMDGVPLVTRMAFAALHRGIVGVLTAFLILFIVFRVENLQFRILQWDGFVVPSRLAYCIYLLHLNIVHILIGSKTQLAHVSGLSLIINHLGIVTLSYIMALPCFLLVEGPFSQLNKMLFTKAFKVNEEIEILSKKDN